MSVDKESYCFHSPGSIPSACRSMDLIVFAAALIAYAPIVSGWYTADDFWHLESFSLPLSTVVKHILFGHVYLDHPDWHYRPLTNFMLMLVCRSHSALIGHFLSVVVHAATGMALYRLLLRMKRGDIRALTGALLFVLLPAAAPAVCWISSIGDLLSGFFSVCAAILYISDTRTRTRVFFMGGLFALALLSKEMCVTLPFLLLFFSLSRKTLRKDVRYLIVLFAILAAFAVVRTAIVGNPITTPGADHFTAISRKTFVNVLRYLSLLVVPAPTHMLLLHPLSILMALPLAVTVILGAGVNGWARTSLGLAGGFAALLFSLLPVANMFAFWYGYMPAALFAVVISGVLPRSYKPLFAWAAGAMLVVSGVNVFLIATEWQHAGTFQKKLFAEIGRIPDDTLQFGNFPRLSYSATLLSGQLQLRAGLAYLYGVHDRTIYINAPRWYEHLAPNVTLRMERGTHFFLRIPSGCPDYFIPYSNDSDPYSSGVKVKFSDYTSFSGNPRTMRIDFPHATQLIQVEPVENGVR